MGIIYVTVSSSKCVHAAVKGEDLSCCYCYSTTQTLVSSSCTNCTVSLGSTSSSVYQILIVQSLLGRESFNSLLFLHACTSCGTISRTFSFLSNYQTDERAMALLIFSYNSCLHSDTTVAGII